MQKILGLILVVGTIALADVPPPPANRITVRGQAAVDLFLALNVPIHATPVGPNLPVPQARTFRTAGLTIECTNNFNPGNRTYTNAVCTITQVRPLAPQND